MSQQEAMTLKPEHHRALHLFAWDRGRRWKQALRDSWMRACADLPEALSGEPFRQPLQFLRNDPGFGPRGLTEYRLPAGFAFRQTEERP